MNFANLILLMFLYFNLDLSLSLELFRVLDERLEVVNNQDLDSIFFLRHLPKFFEKNFRRTEMTA